jgi:tRNA-dihydrouridine synthase B
MAVQLAGLRAEVMADAAEAERGTRCSDHRHQFRLPGEEGRERPCRLLADADEVHAARILEATVKAVKLPVTLKMRTGWDSTNRNAPNLAPASPSSAASGC